MAERPLTCDVVVVGAGLAGFAAAIALKRRRKNVLVVARNPGATSVSSGAWDFGPISDPGASLPASVTSESWRAVYRKILVERPEVLASDSLKPMLNEVMEALSQDLPLVLRPEKPFCLPTSQGQWKLTYGSQQLHSGADLWQMGEKTIGLVASEHWRFRADLVSELLTATAMQRGVRLKISPLWIDLRLKGADWALPRMAAQLSHDGALQNELVRGLHRRLEGSHYDVLLFPPIFSDVRVAEALEKDFHCTIAEMLSTTEPVAGHRLTTAIQRTLDRLQIPLYEVRETQALHSDGLVRGLKGYVNGGWQEFKARHYILATGKFFGGGIALGYPDVKETVLGLSVFHTRSSEPITVRSQVPWDERGFLEEQAWARLGLWVDSKWRPMDTSGKPTFANVSACGSIVGGVDYARENVGLGFMAYSGKGCADELD